MCVRFKLQLGNTCAKEYGSCGIIHAKIPQYCLHNSCALCMCLVKSNNVIG